MPNTLDTRFDTASVTKLFTAIATLQLIDRGLLAFDDQDIAVTLLSNMEDDV
jgi:CubicO group peptidase (beta-lactamase class C family)